MPHSAQAVFVNLCRWVSWLRAPNIMKRVCVAARTVDNAKRAAADIANISKARDKVSGRSGCNPSGWHDFSPGSASRSSPIFAILASSRSLIRAKIVTAHHVFHYVRDSKFGPLTFHVTRGAQ